MEKHDKYNGWTNYETWTVKLWIDNDDSFIWGLLIEAYQDDGNGKKDVYGLAQRIREEIEEGNPLDEPSMYNQLLSAALSEVNWQEIAQSLLEE